MNKRNIVLILFILLFSFGMLSGNVRAESVGFTVKANIPENQIDKKQTYFDLKMEKGQKQELVVNITNNSNEKLIVSIKTISASTSKYGLIDYQTPGIRDITLINPFSEIAIPEKDKLEIEANSSIDAVINLEMPEEEYDGIILGGILISKEVEDSDEGAENKGVEIKNTYSYVIGVKLTETDVKVEADFEALKALVNLDNSYITIENHIRNKEAAMIKDVNLTIDIYNSSNKLVKSESNVIEMAPNSLMKYSFRLEDKIKPGNYESRITMEKNGKEWNFTLPFEVEDSEAKELNEVSLDEKEEFPLWGILIIGINIILIVLIIYLLYKLKNKKQ